MPLQQQHNVGLLSDFRKCDSLRSNCPGGINPTSSTLIRMTTLNVLLTKVLDRNNQYTTHCMSALTEEH